MPINAKYLFVASIDVEPDKEDLFNEVYNQEHVRNLLKVPGVLSVARYKMGQLTMLIEGEKKIMQFENEPQYHAFYEITSPDVLQSESWGTAVEHGRWPQAVRPYTKNRRHILSERVG